MQQLLASLTGISAKEQILMSEGVPLDASKPLASYQLPMVSIAHACWICQDDGCLAGIAVDCPPLLQDQQNKTRDVFLYNKAHLRSNAVMPPPESLPPAPDPGEKMDACIALLKMHLLSELHHAATMEGADLPVAYA